jgi:hypothetical protein
VIEHVADPMEFCKSLAALTKKNGIVFISTLNRSIQSFGLAIVAAEYVLGWVCFLFLSKSPLNLSITGLTAVTTVWQMSCLTIMFIVAFIILLASVFSR